MLDYSSPTPKWKHVLTRGFLTYRAQATLLTDPATGRMFLFGGYINTDWVPSGKHKRTRSFGDVWQFRVDVPGGFFEEVDMDDEERTALVGPWQKCFSCGSIGPWKKCGGESCKCPHPLISEAYFGGGLGTCRGRAFFCDPQCLKDG
ncbi:hypothetical protein SCP_1402030 [Sparassis crispa]|uniref:Uncharacterized protein n=1 Tax=Sparassis crispa TaxID=139825 RepID=A0A401H2Z6_9APHY|nr:hypothetical protein SCP_1402030 [Sparassis crispa]GBE88798.1 hypothetical protein SCP_1402030 [Sparassis crispa]